MRRTAPVALAFALVLGSHTARADEPTSDCWRPEVHCDPPPPYDPDWPPPGGWRLMLSDLTIARVNPLGLETRGRLGLQKRLYLSTSAVARNNFAFVGLYPKLNPASAQLGVGGEVQPLSMLNVRALVEAQQYFGTFGYLQSFASADDNYSDHTLKALRDDPVLAPQKAAMFHASVQPMLMAKVGPIALRALGPATPPRTRAPSTRSCPTAAGPSRPTPTCSTPGGAAWRSACATRR